jgi:hypothetical protein
VKRAVVLVVASCGRLGFDASSGDASTQQGDASDALVGDATGDGGLTASAWELAGNQPSTTEDLWGVIAFSSDDVWISGTAGTLQHFTASTWTPQTTPAIDTLFMLWGTASDIWVVGRGCLALRGPTPNWSATSVSPCKNNQELFAVDGSSASEVWMVGTSGTVAEWTGGWTDHAQSNIDIWDVQVNSATDVFLVGTLGTLLHYNGSTFAPDTVPNVTLASIWRAAPGEYWVVGQGGTILHKVGTGAWTQVASPTTTFLYAVTGKSTSDVWAVGSGGVIIHYDGVSWQQVASPTAVTLRSLAAVAGGGMVAVGAGGTVLHHP